MPKPTVIHLDVATETLIARLCGRRQCPRCLRLYNVVSQPPRTAGLCDDDVAPLVTREDDCEVAILQRMRAYAEQTGPVLDWFGESLVRRVDASLSPAEVARQIEYAIVRPARRELRPITVS